ncbi:HET-domain-containing protein [Trematosphaeria pertusa]|uniref:HET-domain-containing protein n=1 Tax=Trematosphaeria pertusa TaxID=390896 RepID=A0A6A6IEA0_9PLEO|nr:HET-domain-containing protein [Trematosphaeria pertusa]KAF2248904.1 HET-domain-containing protein [Trematosphaeria pertusa]
MEKPNYFWRILQKSWGFARLPFRLDRWLPFLPRGWRISFGIWVRLSVDQRDCVHAQVGVKTTELYAPLSKGDIRILRLEPGTGSDPLVIGLEHHNLSNAPPYEALSYCWGSERPKRRCFIDGLEVGILPNVEDALRNLRLPDCPRRLWIDSVCINQSYFLERNDQVARMDDIYRCAQQVLVWLGSPDEQSTVGMEALRFFVDPASVPTDAPWYFSSSRDAALGLRSILQRAWWKRFWTVQEAVLARQVLLMCGKHTVRWRTNISTLRRIKFMTKFAATSPQWELAPFHEVDLQPLVEIIEAQIREREEETGVRVEKDILDVRYEFRNRQCTFFSDKLYALLGLAESRRMGLKGLELVDYTQKAEEAHAKFAAVLHGLNPGLDIPKEWVHGHL